MGGMIGCRDYQPLLGMYALGRLTGHEVTTLQAHLDGCPLCRIEVFELQGVAEVLSQADPERVEARPEAPPWLRENVFHEIGADRQRKRRRGLLLGSAGLVAAAALGGFLLTSPLAETSTAEHPSVAYASGNVRASATLSSRPWGTSLNLSVSGLTAGQQYMVWLERPDGHRMPAGSFTALGGESLSMRLTSGMKADNAAALGLSPSTGGPPILRAPIARH